MVWLELVCACAVLAVVLIVPGAVMLRAAGLRWLVALGSGPPLSALVYAVLAPVLAASGVPWNLVSVTAAVVVIVAIGSLVCVTLRRRPGGRDRLPQTGLTSDAAAAAEGRTGVQARGELHVPTPQALTPHAATILGRTVPWRTAFVATVLVSTTVFVVPTVLGMGSPDAPLQQWDGVFHLNGVALVQETGVASSLDGLYGEGRSVYYPAVWHSMVALVPPVVAPPVVAANASTLVMGSVGWLLGLGAFATAVFPGRRGVVLVAVALGSAFSMFPTVQLSTLSQWPNGLSVMLVPGAAALVVLSVHGWQRLGSAAHRALLTSAALASVAGVGAAHGSGVFGGLLVVGPLVLAAVATGVRSLWSSGRRARVVVPAAVLGAVMVVAVVVLSRSSVLQVLMNFERLPQRTYVVSVPRTLLDMVLWPAPGNVVLSVAVVVGAVVLLRRRQERWLVASGVLVVAFVAFAAGPDNPLRALTGIWYTQAARIEALYPVVASLVGAVGVVTIAERAAARWERRRPSGGSARSSPGPVGSAVVAVLAVAFVTSAGFQTPQRVHRFAEAYDPEEIMWGTMLSAEELALVRSAGDLLPEDALVLGDPHNGAAFFYGVGGRDVLLPQLGTSAMDATQTYLRENFRDVDVDPKVCELVRERGVTHFYEDTATVEDGAKVDPESPGLHDVDTSDGFEVVAVAGTATLYEIQACG
ncbi:DUF6541 family protein [Sanguibacter suaedae]|uniref:Uncharacterized protein n=1 Tax=Sanguibacter suaedae TaxID=2795737 RepID=A0A934I8C5_9MICO|nr:DUF6541 family protein [Sanguibacter suaedae]MBI9114065.1 hypothetical protein [Sanguibacter suaedae]